MKIYRNLDRVTRKEVITRCDEKCYLCGTNYKDTFIEVCELPSISGYIILCADCVREQEDKYNRQKNDEALLKLSFSAGSNKRLYSVYQNMLSRCYDSKTPNYKYYGARGISVCEEWRKSFRAFCEWAKKSGYDENAPRSICTIDRINNDGNYEPNNCRWADMKTQCNNKRKKRKKGEIYD